MPANPGFIQSVLADYLVGAPVFKAMLVDSTYVPDPANETGTATAATHEIPGVARVRLANVALLPGDGEVGINADDVVFAGLADGVTDVGGVVIYVEGASEALNQIVAWDLDDGPFDPPAGNLAYVVDDAGIVVFTA